MKNLEFGSCDVEILDANNLTQIIGGDLPTWSDVEGVLKNGSKAVKNFVYFQVGMYVLEHWSDIKSGAASAWEDANK